LRQPAIIDGMGQDQPVEFANVGAHLAEAVAQSKRYAITRVDSVGVIERYVSADVAGEVPLWAQLMREKGVEPGDRVIVLAGGAWEWRCALLGVIYAGGVAVPCPESTPAAELRAIATHARAALVVSIPARPDLVEQDDGAGVLSADQLDTVDAAQALAQPPHPSLPGDAGLILYARSATGLQGTVHTHASLIAQADAGDHWLGVREGERIWCTAPDGSAESVWLLLAAWGERANIVTVDLQLDSEERLELLEKLHPAALWFSDEEYAALASAATRASVDLGSIGRALASDESSAGAAAFEEAFGTRVTPLFGLNELGVVAGWPAGAEHEAVTGSAMPVPGIQLAIVDEQGTQLPAGEVGDVVVRGDTPSLFSGYAGGESPRRDSWLQLGWRGALGAGHSLQLASRPSPKTELVEAEVEMPAAELVEEEGLAALKGAPDESEATSRPSRREAKRARREEERQAKERAKAEEQHRREEEKSRELAERAAAKERKKAERGKRGGRAQRREEKKARARDEQLAKEREKAEERRRREEEKSRELAERAAAKERKKAERAESGRKRRREERQARRREEQEAKERQKAEAAERAEREAAEAEERRRAEEAARVEERRRAEDEKEREREQRREEKEARRREEQEAKKAARAQRKAARPGKRRREAAGQSEPEQLSRDVVSRIKQYGVTAPPADPDERREAEAASEPPMATEPNDRQDAE
jgi:acyl-CoA synthetase (AMP-forming)/AMP-acid ligase II